MKKTQLFFITLILLFLAGACVKQEFDKPPISQLPVGDVYTINDLITMLNTTGATQFNKDASVYAVVTMDETSGNIYRNAYIQDATGAINVRLKESGGLRVGDSIALHPGADADAARVTLPDGTQQTLDRAAIFAETAQPGLYRVEALADGAVIESAAFAVNLFDPDESRIRPANEITLGDTVVTQAAEAEIGQREFWPWLALLALIVLVIEWLLYHRRQRAPVRFKPVARGEAR